MADEVLTVEHAQEQAVVFEVLAIMLNCLTIAAIIFYEQIQGQ